MIYYWWITKVSSEVFIVENIKSVSETILVISQWNTLTSYIYKAFKIKGFWQHQINQDFAQRKVKLKNIFV